MSYAKLAGLAPIYGLCKCSPNLIKLLFSLIMLSIILYQESYVKTVAVFTLAKLLSNCPTYFGIPCHFKIYLVLFWFL